MQENQVSDKSNWSVVGKLDENTNRKGQPKFDPNIVYTIPPVSESQKKEKAPQEDDDMKNKYLKYKKKYLKLKQKLRQ